MEASPSPLVRAATKPITPVAKPKVTKEGMLAISPNAEQARTQLDYMANTGKPLYKDANYGGVNFPVNSVTGAPLGIDRSNMQARSLADAAVDSRLQARALSTPYKQHYGTGLGTGVAPINVMAEQQRNADREAEFEDIRAKNREAFYRAKYGMGMSPTTYKVGRTKDELMQQKAMEGEHGEAAARLFGQERAKDKRKQHAKNRAARGIEYGNALAAANQLRKTGFLPTNSDYLQQMMAARDPRGAFLAQSEEAKVNAQAEALKANNLFKERELGLQEQEMKDNATFRQGQLANQGRQADAAIEHNKLLGEAARAEAAAKKLEAEAKASVLQQSSSILGMLPTLPPALQEDPRIIDAAQKEIYSKAGINPTNTPSQSVTIPDALQQAKLASQFEGMSGKELLANSDLLQSLDAMQSIKDADSMRQLARSKGITPDILTRVTDYQPTLPYRTNSMPAVPHQDVAALAEFQGAALPFWKMFGEGKDDFLQRRRRQESAKTLRDALGVN